MPRRSGRLQERGEIAGNVWLRKKTRDAERNGNDEDAKSCIEQSCIDQGDPH
jgi:hypothetical protein